MQGKIFQFCQNVR